MLTTYDESGKLVFPRTCPAEWCGAALVPAGEGVSCPKGHFDAQPLPRITLRELYERMGFDYETGRWEKRL